MTSRYTVTPRCSHKPVFVGGITGFGEICTNVKKTRVSVRGTLQTNKISRARARAILNGEEIYHSTWKRITSESSWGPSNPDSSRLLLSGTSAAVKENNDLGPRGK